MPNAKIDGNYVATLIAVSSVDLATPVNVAVVASTGAVVVEIGWK